MEVADLMPLVERLEDNVDDLEEVLQPLLERSLADTSSKLPLLDKAKLHVLLTYTLESLLFCYLRLHGVNAREHAVFRELTRVRQYFEKIKALETEPEKRTMTLDKQAAGRFIKHGLAGNDKHDLERAEKEAKEKAMAQMRAAMLAKKSATNTQERQEQKSSESSSDSDSDSDSSSDSESASNSDDSEEATAHGERATKQAEPSIPHKSAKAKAKERREQAKAEKALRKLKQQAQGAQGAQTESKDEAKKARKMKKEKKKAKKKKKKLQAAKEKRAAG